MSTLLFLSDPDEVFALRQYRFGSRLTYLGALNDVTKGSELRHKGQTEVKIPAYPVLTSWTRFGIDYTSLEQMVFVEPKSYYICNQAFVRWTAPLPQDASSEYSINVQLDLWRIPRPINHIEFVSMNGCVPSVWNCDTMSCWQVPFLLQRSTGKAVLHLLVCQCILTNSSCCQLGLGSQAYLWENPQNTCLGRCYTVCWRCSVLIASS